MQKVIIGIIIFIMGIVSGAGGLYLYSRNGLEQSQARVSEIENYNFELLETNERFREYSQELERRLDERERRLGDREKYIGELETIISRSGELNREAEHSYRRIEEIFDKY